MEQGVAMAKHELLDTSGCEEIGEKLRETEKALAQLRELAPRVGLDLDPKKPEAEVSGPD